MSKDNGGPAFPQPMLDTGKGSGIISADEMDFGGMTLRDYFASKAMQGICCNRSHVDLKGHALSSAKTAYALADAMLAERAK